MRREFDRLLAVARCLHIELQVAEQHVGNFPVDRLVFNQQNALAGMFGAQAGFVLFQHMGPGQCGRRGFVQTGREPECAAAPRGAVDANFATHGMRQMCGDGQAQTGAAVFSSDRIVGLLKGSE